MSIKIGELVKQVLSKTGINNPAYNEILDKIQDELPEEIEGEINQKVEGLNTIDGFKNNKAVVSEMKAQFLNGLENQGLKSIVDELDDIDKANYQRVSGTNNKIQFLIDAKIKKAQKAEPNTQSNTEAEDLRKKVLDFEDKVSKGEYVSKQEKDALLVQISNLREGAFKEKIITKILPKVSSHMADADFLDMKVKKFMNNKGLTFDHETGRFIETKDGIQKPATKNDKTVHLMDYDDLVDAMLNEEPNLLKKSDTVPTAEISVPAEVKTSKEISKNTQERADKHLEATGKK